MGINYVKKSELRDYDEIAEFDDNMYNDVYYTPSRKEDYTKGAYREAESNHDYYNCYCGSDYDR